MKKIKFEVIDKNTMKVIIHDEKEVVLTRMETRILENELLDAFIEMMELWSGESNHKENYKYPPVEMF